MVDFMYKNGGGYDTLEHRIDQGKLTMLNKTPVTLGTNLDADLDLTRELNDNQLCILAAWFHQLKVARIAFHFNVKPLERMAIRGFEKQTFVWDPAVFFELVSQCSHAVFPLSVRKAMVSVAVKQARSLSKMGDFKTNEFAEFMEGALHTACIEAIESDDNERIAARNTATNAGAYSPRHRHSAATFTSRLPARPRNDPTASGPPRPAHYPPLASWVNTLSEFAPMESADATVQSPSRERTSSVQSPSPLRTTFRSGGGSSRSPTESSGARKCIVNKNGKITCNIKEPSGKDKDGRKKK